MSERYREEDVLLGNSDNLTDSISKQSSPTRFGNALMSAKFISEQAVRDILSVKADPDYDKVSNMVFATKSIIISQSSQEKTTKKFDEFVLLLHKSLKLEDLAEKLVQDLMKERPSYQSPLPLTFSTGMTEDKLYSWLLSNHLPQDDCETIKRNKINGIRFKLTTDSEAGWKNFEITPLGMIVLEHIMKQVSSSPDTSQANGASTNGASTNGASTNGASTNGASMTEDSNGDRTSQPQNYMDSGRSSAPTVREFIKFPMRSGKVNLADRIGTDYVTFGVLLLEDDNGDVTGNIVREQRERAADINVEVFRLWVAKGRGRKPVSWATLVAVLQDMELNILARDIKEIKCPG